MNDRLLNINNTVENFFTLDDKELMDKISVYAPGLCYSNVQFIRSELKKEGKEPTYATLMLFEAILEERRHYADGAIISEIEADSLTAKETYEDLKKKAMYLYGKGNKSFTLKEAAKISDDYMKTVSREDETILADGALVKDKDALTVFCERSAISFLKKPYEADSGKLNPDMGIALLKPAEGAEEDYEKNISSFSAVGAKYAVHEGKMKVSGYGIIGTLTELCDGVRADVSRLTDSKDCPVTALTSAYKGRYLVVFDPSNREKLIRLAAKHSLDTVYFAISSIDGRFTAMGKESLTLDIPMSLIRALKYSTRKSKAIIENGERVEAKHLTPKAVKSKKLNSVPKGTLITNDNKVITARYFLGNGNGYANTMHALTDMIIELVSYGVNRRSIAFAHEYIFPARKNSEKELGEDLAFILATYRMSMELASPTPYSNIRYSAAQRGMLTTAFSRIPKTTPKRCFVSDDSYICVLSVDQHSDGTVDFKELRRFCDRFFELCRSGRVLSARPVFGSLSDALEKMCGNMSYYLYERGTNLLESEFRGVVFEVLDERRLNPIGEVEKKLDASEEKEIEEAMLKTAEVLAEENTASDDMSPESEKVAEAEGEDVPVTLEESETTSGEASEEDNTEANEVTAPEVSDSTEDTEESDSPENAVSESSVDADNEA